MYLQIWMGNFGPGVFPIPAPSTYPHFPVMMVRPGLGLLASYAQALAYFILTERAVEEADDPRCHQLWVQAVYTTKLISLIPFFKRETARGETVGWGRVPHPFPGWHLHSGLLQPSVSPNTCSPK